MDEESRQLRARLSLVGQTVSRWVREQIGRCPSGSWRAWSRGPARSATSPPFRRRVVRGGAGAGPRPGRRYPSPVALCGAGTGFDSGEPSWRSRIERTTSAPMERNSLCQFWNDSNHSRAVVR